MRKSRTMVMLLALSIPTSANAMTITKLQALALLHSRGRSIEMIVDQDRIDGTIKRLKGSAKETIGKVTGDRKLQAEGAREKAAGKVQKAIGGIKDSVRDIIGK